MNDSRKTRFSPLMIAAGLWGIMVVLDILLRHKGSLSDFSLFGGSDGMFRLLLLGSLLAAGVFITRCMAAQKRTEATLLEAARTAEDERAKSEAIVAALGDGISIQDRDYMVLYQNEVHRAMVGDHVGEYCYRAYQKRDRACDGCHLALSFADGRIYKKEQFRMTDTGQQFVEIISSPLRDSTGEIIAGIELVRDITERKRTEEALTESEKRYRLLFEHAPDAIFIMEAEGEQAGRIVAANRAAAAMHDCTIDELTTLKITDLDSHESAQGAPNMISRILAGEWVKAEISHRRKDGSVFPVEVSAGLLELGNHKYILAFDRDITAHRTAEEGREKLIRELQQALDKIRTLRGLLPICASCKKIRDDTGYWNQIETYLKSHTEADFSHGMCPECAKRLYPKFISKEPG